MSEHLIRLRGGWEWQGQVPGKAPAPSPGRLLTLPLTWPPGLPARVRLARSFRRLPIDPDREALTLRLQSVTGLVAARLNDREIARPDPATASLEVPLDGPLPPRNRLVLEVDPRASDGPWGEIALVIRRIRP